MKKILKALSIVGIIIAFLLIIGSAGGLEQGTMGLRQTIGWCIFGVAIGYVSAFCYSKVDN
jgi:hypothetical protein